MKCGSGVATWGQEKPAVQLCGGISRGSQASVTNLHVSPLARFGTSSAACMQERGTERESQRYSCLIVRCMRAHIKIRLNTAASNGN